MGCHLKLGRRAIHRNQPLTPLSALNLAMLAQRTSSSALHPARHVRSLWSRKAERQQSLAMLFMELSDMVVLMGLSEQVGFPSARYIFWLVTMVVKRSLGQCSPSRL